MALVDRGQRLLAAVPVPSLPYSACVVFFVTLAYLALFVHYGINFDDEGTLLYQFAREADGQRPYQDFHAGYTPGAYYLHSFLQHAFDQSLLPGRVCLALVNSASAALLFLILAPLAGSWASALGVVLYVALMPVHPGYFAVFNVPYPSWYSGTWFLLGLLPSRQFLLKRSPRAGLCAGAAAGLAFFFKPNVGAFQLACAMLLVLAALPRAAAFGHPRQRAWWWAMWLAVVGALLAVFGFAPATGELLYLLLPAFACAALSIRLSGSTGELAVGNLVITSTLAVVSGFGVVTAIWLLPLAVTMPVRDVLEKVLFIGSDFAPSFYEPHPPVLLAAALLVVAYGGLMAAGRRLTASERWLRLAGPIALGLACATLAAVLALRPMVQGFSFSVTRAFEQVWSYRLGIAVHWLLIALVWLGVSPQLSRFAGTARLSKDALASLVVLAYGSTFLYLQIYPRTDFTHWVWATPLSMAGGVWLLRHLVDIWTANGRRNARLLLLGTALSPVLLLIALRAMDSFSAIAQWNGWRISRATPVTLDVPHAPVWTNIGQAERYRDATEVVALLQAATTPEESVVAFPVLDVILYLARRPNSLPDSYFFPRWLDHDDEATAIATMERQRTRFVVVLRESRRFFEAAPAYYQQFGTYLEREYRSYATVGRYEVFARRDATTTPVSRSISRGSPEARLQQHIRARLEITDRERRLAAVRALAGDRIEGYYPELTALLQDDDARVRNAAVQALTVASDDRVARDLAAAALGGGLDAREQALALRLAGAWAGPLTAGMFVSVASSGDPGLQEAARQALGHCAQRRVQESFWFAFHAESDWTLSAADKAQVRQWLRDPHADERLKNFAAATAGPIDAVDGVLEEFERICPGPAWMADANAAPVAQEDPCMLPARAVLAGLAPLDSTRAALLMAVASAEATPSHRLGRRIAYALALRLTADDDLYAPAAALRFLRADPDARQVVKRAIGSSVSEFQRQTLLYLERMLVVAGTGPAPEAPTDQAARSLP